jgi:cell fate regulator YaaT (PSP1 superfamily)
VGAGDEEGASLEGGLSDSPSPFFSRPARIGGAASPPAEDPWLRSNEADAQAEAAEPPPAPVIKVRPAEFPLLAERSVRSFDVCLVRLRATSLPREYECRGETYATGDWILVDTQRGPRVGQVILGTRRRPLLSTPRRVLRRARPDDLAERDRQSTAESDAHRYCKERVRARQLPMKLVNTDLVPGQKATFFFACEDRVEVRDLVRDLTQQLHIRIELRQIGARDGAKLVGGLGSCGRELCCTTFLPAFQPVSIRMAKDQGMVLNPSKLAGQCGRLKCCLIYEHHTYKEMGKGLPKVGKRVHTPLGIGRVLDLDILRQRVRVQLPEGVPQVFEGHEVRSLHAVDPNAQAADAADGPDAPDPGDDPTPPSLSERPEGGSDLPTL